MGDIEPGLRVGRYEIVRKLGQGGFGILFVARDRELDREVALKFLRPEHVTRVELMQRFLQEARSAAKINHAGIVTVFECGVVVDTNTRADGTVYIAMELLQGESLAARMKRERRLSPELAIGLIRQICSALAAAHEAGIVHRDLKPDNIFLVPDPAVRGGERVKILDFGVAKLADGQFASGVRTHSAMVLGTPMYMSPEQCKSSAKVDHRSDIYAVGCILFELLTGRTPYDGDAGELIAKHQLAPVPTPRSVLPEITPELDRLVTQMLAKTPDERPGTMTFVDEALATLEDPKGAAKAAKATKKAARPAEPHVSKHTSATTLVEGAGETTASTASIPRWKLAAGGLGVIVLGVVLGLVFTGGNSNEVSEGPTAPVARDAAVIVPDAPPVQNLVQEITEAPPPEAPCDAAALKAKGDDYLQTGQDAAALVAFEASMICKPDASMLRLAFMAACRAKNDSKAKQHYAAMPQNEATARIAQVCIRNGIDPTPTETRPIDESDLKVACLKLAADRKWDQLLACTDRLAATDATTASSLRKKASDERRAKTAFEAVESALAAKNYKSARSALDRIPTDSVYKADARAKFDEVTAPVAQDYLDRARAAAGDKNCRLVDKLQREAASKGLGDRVSSVKCGATTVATETTTPSPSGCDAAALKAKGDDHLQTGMDAAALAAFEASMRCKPDSSLIRLAFMAACRSRNTAKAKLYFGKLPQNEATSRIAQICDRNGIKVP